MTKYRVLVVLTLFLGAVPATADEIFAARGDEILRIDPSQGSATVVGSLDVSPGALAFSSQGELYALEAHRLYRVDPDSLAAELITELSGDYVDMTVAPDGDIYFLQAGAVAELTRLDPAAGLEIDVAELDRDMGPIFFRQEQLFGGFGNMLYAIDRVTGETEEVWEADSFSSYFSLDADTDGRLWTLVDPPITPPNIVLAARDLSTGEPIPDSYVDFGPDGPSTFAVRGNTVAPISIPTLSTVSLTTLAAALALLGFAVLRRSSVGK